MLERRIINNLGLLVVTGFLTTLSVTPNNSNSTKLINGVAIAMSVLGLYNTVEIKNLEAYQDMMINLRKKKTALMLTNHLEMPVTDKLSLTKEQQNLYVDIARLCLQNGKEPIAIIQSDWGIEDLDQGVQLWQQLLPEVSPNIPGLA